MPVVASQLAANISISGAQQAQATFSSMSSGSNKVQANLSQLQSVAQEVSNVVQNKFAQALRSSQGPLQQLAQQASDAGIDTTKLSDLQAKAAVAADNLAVAQDRAAAALQKAANVTIDAASSEADIIAAQDKASLAADKVVTSENAAAAAMSKLKLEAENMSTAVAASSEKSGLFAGMMTSMQEKSSTFFGGIKEGVGGLLDFGSKVGMTVMGIQGMASMFMSAANAAGSMIGDFQQQMTKLTTTAGESEDKIKLVGDGILNMAGPTATSVKDLGDAMYWVESGGFHGAAGLNVLKTAAMGAKAENADATEVTKVLTAALNTYRGTGLTAAGAMNTLIAAVGHGSMTMNDLTGAVSNVLPVSAKFGISLADTTAGLSTMTMQGDDASSAATHLRQIILALEAPASKGADALKAIGLSSQEVSDAMRKSLPGAIELVTDHLKNKFPEGSAAYNEALKDISGGNKQMLALLETSGGQLQVFKDNVAAVTGAVQKGGNSIMGWDEVQKNFNFRMDQAKDAVGAYAIKIGTALAPVATNLIGFFTGTALPALEHFSDWFIGVGIPAIQHFADSFNQVVAPLQQGIGWLDNFVGHGQSAIPILSGIGAVIAAVLIPAILAAIPPLGTLAIEVITATWPFLALAAAVGGLTAIFLHFYNSNAGFKTFVDGAVSSLEGFWTILTSNIMPVLKQVGDFISSTFAPVWGQLQDVWKSQLQPALQELWTSLKQLQPELTIVGEIIGGVLLVAIGLLVESLGGIIGSIAGMAHGIAEIFGGIVQIVSGYIQIFTGFVAFIVDLFTGHFDKLGGDLKVILGGIGQIFSGFGNTLKGIVDTAAGGVVGGFKGMVGSSLGYLNDLVHGVHDKTEQASDAAKQHTLEMKIQSMRNSEEMSLGVIQNLDKMRMGIADELDKTTDVTKKKSLEVKLTQVTNAEDTAVKTWEAQKKSRQNAESELDKFKASSAQKWGSIQKDVQNIWGGIGNWFHDRWVDVENAFGGVGNWFHEKWSEAWSATTSVFGAIGGWFTDRWHDVQNVFGGIGNWFHDRWNDVMNATAPFRTYMGDVFQTIWNILVALWGKLGQWFNDRWTDVKNFLAPIGGWFHDKWQEAWNATTAVFGAIGKWFGDRWHDIQNVFAAIGGWFHDRWNEAWNAIVLVFTPIGHWFTDRWHDIQNIFVGVGNWFHDRFTEAWTKVTQLWQPIGKWFGDRWNDIMGGLNTFKTAVSNKWNEIKNDTSTIFKGMINGIIDLLNDGISAIESFINFFGQGLDNIATSLGTKGTIPVAHLGRIAHYAAGTPQGGHPGGPMVVGEKGRELLFAPKGSTVVPNDITESLLSMFSGRVPGYAGGIGDIASSIMGWVSGGAKSLLDNVVSALNIKAPNLPGMSNISSGIFSSLENWALSWINSILPKFNFSTGAGGHAVNIPGNLQSWILSAMGITGVPGNWAGPLGTIAMAESGGNPNAINRTDSNAQAGHPSQGIMQTIPSTFAAYALSGHNNILNPIDNIIAGIRYIESRYGTVFNVPGIVSMSHGGSYVGYANGGVINEPISGVGLHTGTRYAFGEHGKELVTPYVPSGVNLAQSSQSVTSSQPSKPQDIVLQIDGRTFARVTIPYTIAEVRNSLQVRI